MSTSAILNRIKHLLDTTPPFDRLTEEERGSLLPDVTLEFFEPGEVILAQGSPPPKGLYIVESGLVRLMDIDAQRLIDKCGEGDTFGAFGLIKGGALIYEAKAVEPTVCALLKGERFRSLYETNREFAAFFDSDLNYYARRLGTEVDVSGAYRLTMRLAALPHRRPVTGPPSTTAQEAARRMAAARVGAFLVVEDHTIRGILTDRDLRNRLVAQGLPPRTPVRELMSSPVLTVPAETPLFETMMTLIDRDVHRLVVLDENGRPCGILTDRDLAHFRGQDPVATVDRIETASSLPELSNIRAETSELLLRFYRQDVRPEQLMRILSIIYDRIAVRVLELVEAELAGEDPEAAVSLPWVWLRLGSGGRREMTLASRQHNALLYADPATPDEAARAETWFARLAERANAALERCGFLNSETVARTPACRLPLRTFKKTFRTWIFEAGAGELTGAPILFFDLRGIYGAMSLVDALKQDIEDALNMQAMDPDRAFIQMMAAGALKQAPPLSFFRRFVLERSGEHRNAFDIRTRGILPVVDAARVLALEARFLESTNTFDRLRHAADVFPDLRGVIETTLEAYQFLFDFRLEHHLRAVEGGEAPDNHIIPAQLSPIQRNLLRKAFGTVAELQAALTRRYDLGRGWLSPRN
ncbi:MAG: hypothetical protein KatS3mg043_1644 [Rhodothermaceae bacterium]|nr:MAG: hypothetical protein KatS3mg043_1644 [Rhodothermaceae bacterium]